MTNHTEALRFLQEVFPDHTQHAIFANLNPPFHTRDWTKLDTSRDCYWSIGIFPDDGVASNAKVRATGVQAFVVDDVGRVAGISRVSEDQVMLALGPPTAAVETSAGNFQWAYRLPVPVAVEAWGSFFDAVNHLVGGKLDPSTRDAVHLFRLPMGVHTKPERNRFGVRLSQLNSGVQLSGIALTTAFVVTKPETAGVGGRVNDPLDRRALEAAIATTPNDASTARTEWTAVGHGLKALAACDEDGFAVFDAWSQLWPGDGVHGYDAAETRRAWDSFGAGGLQTKGASLRERGRQALARLAFDDNPEPPPADPPPFERGANNEILKTMLNAGLGLVGLGVVCRYDEFHHRYIVARDGKAQRLSDQEILLLRVALKSTYDKDFGPVHVLDAVMALGLRNRFNPVTEMLAKAERSWDGVKRLDRLAADYFNTEDTEPAKACFRKVMLAAVRRARQPGCKFDQILVCESPEGWNKSSAWAVLAGDGNFSDESILGKNAREVQEQLADIWIHENADLSGLNKSDVEHVKAFASRTSDRARPAYGRVLIDQPRQSIEVGTTNAESYLLSPTGNRRFWPFTLREPVRLDWLRRDRLQLWGEAAAAESRGETLVLPAVLWPVMGEAQEERRVIDTWEIELENLPPERIELRDGWEHVTGLAIQEYLSGYRRQTFNSGSGRKIAEIMRRLGWKRTRFRVDGGLVRGYKRQKVLVWNASGTASGTEKPL